MHWTCLGAMERDAIGLQFAPTKVILDKITQCNLDLRQLAAGIPGARFVALQGNNHILLEHDPATRRFFEEISIFFAG